MAPNASDKFPVSPGLATSAAAPEVCMPTHKNLSISALALVAHFNAQGLVDEESLPHQEHAIWHSG